MNYTDEQLKQLLVKMLPDKLAYFDDLEGIFYITENNTQEDWLDGLLIPVLDTELLQLCHLVEDTLDVDINSGNSPRYTYSRELYRIVAEPRQPFRATWQERVIALAAVKGIGI